MDNMYISCCFCLNYELGEMEKERHNRNKIEVIESILKYVEREGKAKKTRILYAANLNTKSLETILADLVNSRALEIVSDGNGKKMYKITPIGARLLMLITRIRRIIKNATVIEEHLVRNIKEFCKEIVRGAECVSIDQSLRLGTSVKGRSARTYFVDLFLKLKDQEYIIGFLSKDATEHEIQHVLSWLIIVSLDTGYNVILFVSEDKILSIKRYLSHIFDHLKCDSLKQIKEKFSIRDLRIV